MGSILVTGGAGFIGSHTCLSLIEKGYEVIILDSLINSKNEVINRIKKICKANNDLLEKNLKFFKCDLREINKVEKIFSEAINGGNPIKGVIHFAGLKSVGESIKNPILYWDVNLISSINLVRVMDKFDCRNIVFSSSATLYGQSSKELLNEETEIKPINPYGTSKYGIELFLDDVFKSTSEIWSIAKLRYFNPIGAHCSGLIGENPVGIPNNIFPLLLDKTYKKKENLKIFGNDWPTIDGTGVRDYIHVMDLAEAHIKILEHITQTKNKNLNLNIGTGKGTSVLELIKIFEKTNNVKVPFEIVDRRPGDAASVVADNQLLKSTLNWLPKLSLEEMCRDGWNWKIKNPFGY
ncbi:UDP-glucose 4-epimerase GalE [Prochlorococcus marinus]|uniref:UDP-glucose 4-epimerase GalE n=1 Tax=Prochlorococcus marinus TaxID=1219 RepID=UPI000190059B|nr:UDP-glucose 4-epimerase GalE [Prochlorococcus marinus]EEE40961.1 UDP-glucose 4-epimerase [Prochlorococcus marinus str. MIT 9202]